jgi:transcriptional regulator with XRE-family HTH domain
MRQLLAYLLVRKSDGTWDVGSHRNLETLLDSWKAVPDAGACAVVHTGFWRPDTSELEAAASGMRGKVLLTDAAKWALPQQFKSSSRPRAEAGGLFLYEALSGWGYEKEDDSGAEQPPEEGARQTDLGANRSLDLPCKWLDELSRRRPDLWRDGEIAGVHDERSYLQNEWRMSDESRDELASLRFAALTGTRPDEENIIRSLEYAPPWLLAMNIDALALSARPANRLAEEEVKRVADLIKFGFEGLTKIPNMGLKSIHQIASKILEAWNRGSAFCSGRAFEPTEKRHLGSAVPPEHAPMKIEKPGALPAGSSFLSGLQEAMFVFDERETKVLELRMGLHGTKCTLDEIGKLMGVTRERVRQIESRAVKKIAALIQPWIERLEKGAQEALRGREEPLPLLGLEVVDPWFAGVGENERPLAYALRHFNGGREFFLVRIAGQTYFSAISQEGWEESLRKTKALLEDLVKVDKSMPEDEARCLVESMLSGAGEELRPLLWKECTKWAHFSKTPSGESRLASFGMGAEGIVEAVLLESERPLHFEEIAKRCKARGRDVEARRAHNAAANIGILMAPGTYGLEAHFPLSGEEVDLLVSEAEDTIMENPARQWHADELTEILGEAGLDFGGRLNKYVLNHALKSSQALVYLGRMVWQVKGGARSHGTADRIDVWQAVAAALERNGSPMRTEEIRQALSKDRGLGIYSLAVLQSDPVIRVGEGTWGLLWRDVPFSESESKLITDELEEIMREIGEGLHVSEVAGALRRSSDLAARVRDPILLVSLCVRTGRISRQRADTSIRRIGKGRAGFAPTRRSQMRSTTPARLGGRYIRLPQRQAGCLAGKSSLMLPRGC